MRILGSYHMPGLILHSNVHLKLVFRKEKVSEFAELYDLVYDEIPTGEILKLNPKYIRYIDKIAPKRIEIMNEK